MQNNGWRTLMIESFDKLSYCDGSVAIQGESETQLPVSQLRCIIASSAQGSISVPLLNTLSENHVELIICDGKRNPSCELVPIAQHTNAAGCILRQSKWSEERKADLWQKIIRAKIENQIALLRLLKIPVPDTLQNYLAEVEPGDPTNREGQAARVYFAALFGNEFIRHSYDDTNAALNYGYTILQSAFTRMITAHGYHTALGIHHHSQYNRFNLSCDLMEPFRPFVDRVVWENAGRTLDWEYKSLLIAVLYDVCNCDGKRMSVQLALEDYTLSAFESMAESREKPLKEVTFHLQPQCDFGDV